MDALRLGVLKGLLFLCRPSVYEFTFGILDYVRARRWENITIVKILGKIEGLLI